MTASDEGLDTAQVVSVGRKPVPLNEILWSEPLNEITGSDWTVKSIAFAAKMTNAQTTIVPMSLNGTPSHVLAANY
jgi:hypothetical protein